MSNSEILNLLFIELFAPIDTKDDIKQVQDEAYSRYKKKEKLSSIVKELYKGENREKLIELIEYIENL